MKATFFPFTDISQPLLAAATAVFERLLLYRPSRLEPTGDLQAWVDRGALEIRIPVQGDEERLGVLLQEYRQWAELRGGGDLGRFKGRQEEIPFFDDQSPLKLRAEILGQGAGAKHDPDPADALFQARVFLQMAQAFDRQQHELHQALAAVDDRQQAMLRELGDYEKLPPGASRRPAPAPDPGAHMTAERVAAWARLALQAPPSDAVLLTGSPAAWDLLADRFPATVVLAQWPVPSGPWPDGAAVARWRGDVLTVLDGLARSPWPGAEAPVLPPPPAEPSPSEALTLKLALVPETPLPLLLAGLSAKTPAAAQGDRADPQRHSLLALIV
jgi:hypothetical protein